MRALVFFCLAVCLTLVPSAAQRISSPVTDTAKYIGLRHGATLPPELKWIGSGLVSGVGDTKEYAMAEIHKGATHMLWFQRMTHRDDGGHAYWEVTDVMVMPRVPKRQVFVYTMCLLNNRPDGEIAAVADNEEGVQYFTRVRKAWRANRQTEKFEAIPTKGIKCENVGFGI